MMFGRPVAARAILTAFSTASAPEFVKKKLSIEDWDDLSQFFDQLQHRFMDDDVSLRMKKKSSLFANRLDHFRMAMAGIGHADAASEVKQLASIFGVNIRAFSTLGNKIEDATPRWSHMRKIFFVKLIHYQFLIHSKRDRDYPRPFPKKVKLPRNHHMLGNLIIANRFCGKVFAKTGLFESAMRSFGSQRDMIIHPYRSKFQTFRNAHRTPDIFGEDR